MALPRDINALFAPIDEGPPLEQWVPEFSGYRWFRVVGFPARLNRAGVGLQADFGEPGRSWPLLHKRGRQILFEPEVLRGAAGRIPQSWRDHPELVDIFAPGQGLSPKQMKAALADQPLMLDRACLVVAALDILFERQGHGTKRIENHVRIAPAFFWMRDFTSAFYKEHFDGSPENEDRFDLLKRLSTNPNPDFFAEISDGRGATFSSLKKVQKVLKESLKLNAGQITYHRQRGQRHPSEAEVPIFPGD